MRKRSSRASSWSASTSSRRTGRRPSATQSTGTSSTSSRARSGADPDLALRAAPRDDLAAGHARVPGREDPARVRLPDPRVERVERRQAESIGCGHEVELAPEERGWLRALPVALEDDVLECRELELPVLLFLVD